MALRRIRKSTASGPQQTDQQLRPDIPSPPPRIRRVVEESSSRQPLTTVAPPLARGEQTPPSPGARPKQQRGHARKDANGKWQPTGDYDVGFGKPPKAHQFDGTQRSPGRPKNSRSQDSYMRDELEQVRTIRIDGMPKKLKQRQLVSKLIIANALEKKSDKALSNVHDYAQRLFPDARPVEATMSPMGDMGMDEAVLRQLFAGLALGEPKEGASDPLMDLLRQPLGPEDSENDEEWGEGDWDVPGEEPVDE